MTPEERAEKIASQYCNVGLPEIPHIPGKCPLADDIAAEIRAAVEEGVIEWRENNKEGWTTWAIDRVAKAKAEAFEQAAKMVERLINESWDIPMSLPDKIRELAKSK